MIGGELNSSRFENLIQQLARMLSTELPAWQLLAIATAAGLLWASSLFDSDFIFGRHEFWRFPMGIDMQLVLAAYFYYIGSPWHLPLFYVSALGAPVGANIIFTDAVPVVALTGKLLQSFTGITVNFYGAYLFLCFALPGVMMVLVLIAARARCTLAAVIGAIFANAMPALLWRWGHIALEAHFLLIGALALYLFSLRKSGWRGVAAAWAGCLALAYLTNIYLFAMVGVVWLCAHIQRRLDRLATTREALATAALTAAPAAFLIALGGQFGAGGALPFSAYGHYSMNLLSPFVPQTSGIVPGMRGIVDATGGQYEGYNYLGLGLLLSSLLVLKAETDWLKHAARRHIALLSACTLLAAFAISHRAFFGHWLLLKLPMPNFVNSAFGIFRSSGRFFWLIGYAQVAIVVVLACRDRRPLVAFCLLLAAIIQLFDVQPLRARIVASIAAGPGPAELDQSRVARLVTGARLIEVVPSFQCSDNPKQISANMELMLAAARADVPTNTIYLARQSYGLSLRDVARAPSDVAEMLQRRRSEYCEREIEQMRNGGPGDVLVLLSDQLQEERLAPGVICSPLSWARSCEWPRR